MTNKTGLKVIKWLIPALCVLVGVASFIFEIVAAENAPSVDHVFNPNLAMTLLVVEALAVVVLGIWGIVMLIKAIRRAKKTAVKVTLGILVFLLVPGTPAAALYMALVSGLFFYTEVHPEQYIRGEWCTDVPEAVQSAYMEYIPCPEGRQCYTETIPFAGGTFERIFDIGPVYWVDMYDATKPKLPCKSIEDINPNLDRPYTTEEERKTWVTLPGLPPLPPDAAEELKQQGY